MNQKHPSNQAACNAAIELAMAGYGVFPVYLAKKPGEEKKLPNYGGGSWYDNIEFGPPDVEARFEAMPGANAIGVATGQSGVVGIDIDVSTGKDGYAALKDAGIELPSTPMRIRTWSGGMHYYFRAPDIPIRNKTNSPVAGVDVRGEGGHLYAPGSSVDDSGGARYEVAEGARIVPVDELPVLPAEWVELLTDSARKRVRLDDPIEIDPDRYSEKGKADIGRWIERELDKARKAPGLPHHDDEKPSVLSVSSSLSLSARWLGSSFEDSLDVFIDAYQEGGRNDLDDVRKTFEGDWANVPRREPPSAELAGYEAQAPSEWEQRIQAGILQKQERAEIDRRYEEQRAGDFDLGVCPVDVDLPNIADQMIVGDLWMQGETHVLLGDTYVGKSHIALDAALSVANGVPWAGGTNVIQGRVLYIAGEGQQGLIRRAQNWARVHGTPKAPESFVLATQMPNMRSQAHALKLAKLIADSRVDLVVIDTLKRAVGGLGANESEKWQTASDNFDLLRSIRKTCAVVVVAHPNKEGELPGNNNFAADVFNIVSVTNDFNELVLSVQKWKDGDEPYWGDRRLRFGAHGTLERSYSLIEDTDDLDRRRLELEGSQ